MYQVIRDATARGLDAQKGVLAERLRRAASKARESAPRAEQGAVVHATGWLAGRLDGIADAIDSRRIDEALDELRELAHRHPGATLAVAAAVAFVCTRLAMPLTTTPAVGLGADEGGRLHG